MPYSGQETIVGLGTVSAEAIQAWFTHAARFRKGAAALPIPPDLGAAIVAEAARYPQYPINHDLAAAQILHETDAWQSEYAQERRNPGGIGAVNHDPDQAIFFPSVRAGVQAHMAHLLVYAVGEGPWSAADPRIHVMRQAGYVGTARRWVDLNGKWAWPGTSYGQSIAGLAGELLHFAENGSWNVPSIPLAPVEVVRRVLPRNASNTPQRTMDWQYITVHNTGNPRPGADALMHARWLESLAAGLAGEPSWHYTVDQWRAVQHLEDDQAGWHASDGEGPGNLASLGFELVEVGDQQAVLRNAAWLIAQRLHAKGFGVGRLRQHHDWARDKKNCPRLLRANGGAGWQQLQTLVQAELDRLATPGPDPVSQWPQVPDTQPDPWRTDNPWGRDRWIPDVFVARIQAEGFMHSGYVLTEAFAEENRIVQYFERARWELHEDGSVHKGLIGYEALVARYPERKR